MLRQHMSPIEPRMLPAVYSLQLKIDDTHTLSAGANCCLMLSCMNLMAMISV